MEQRRWNWMDNLAKKSPRVNEIQAEHTPVSPSFEKPRKKESGNFPFFARFFLSRRSDFSLAKRRRKNRFTIEGKRREGNRGEAQRKRKKRGEKL